MGVGWRVGGFGTRIDRKIPRVRRIFDIHGVKWGLSKLYWIGINGILFQVKSAFIGRIHENPRSTLFYASCKILAASRAVNVLL
jgi:hypothetical protein